MSRSTACSAGEVAEAVRLKNSDAMRFINRPPRSSAAMVFSKAGAAGLAAIASTSRIRSASARSNAGAKCSARMSPNGGRPNGAFHAVSRGLVGVSGTVADMRVGGVSTRSVATLVSIRSSTWPPAGGGCRLEHYLFPSCSRTMHVANAHCAPLVATVICLTPTIDRWPESLRSRERLCRTSTAAGIVSVRDADAETGRATNRLQFPRTCRQSPLRRMDSTVSATTNARHRHSQR